MRKTRTAMGGLCGETWGEWEREREHGKRWREKLGRESSARNVNKNMEKMQTRNGTTTSLTSTSNK